MNPLQKHQKSIERYINAYNAFNIAGMLAELHPDIRFQHISQGEVNLQLQGLAAFRKQAEQAAALFRQRKQTIRYIEQRED
ncbi:nuclear transport factor 2 family protein, partial [Cesiribacter andamanensis]|uniref:nuclear transport factor 2 family protein n=1 Tax=Cesiribacter andamanensis TaxID=649507 RepID=UPI00059101F6